MRATLRAACQVGSGLYRGDRHCGGPHGFPCGECRGGTTFDRVLYRQVHRAANWSIGHGIVHSVKEGYYAIFL